MSRFRRRSAPQQAERGLSVDAWMSYLGQQYPLGVQTSWASKTTESIPVNMAGLLGAMAACPPAFAAQLIRANLLMQARFVWRSTRAAKDPGKIFGTPALELLERPWPRATTAELLNRIEWYAGPAGNAYVWRDRLRGRLKLLRPDWTTIVIGSDQEPEMAAWALDSEVVGYVYTPGGPNSGARSRVLDPSDVVHWAPIPDPLAAYRGMSWLTPVVREMQGDTAATEHKLKFFDNAATPNMVFTLDKSLKPEAVQRFAELINEQSSGTANAYRNLFLGGGADVTVVGTDLKQLDFANIQGAGENRISVASRVPASILGIREGLQGSALNAGNFGQARRVLADSWLHPTLTDLCAALEPIVTVPERSELWYDPDIPFLREDAKEAADIVSVQAQSIRSLVEAGYTPESAIAAVQAGDFSLLEHSGLFSVQLQAAGQTTTQEDA